MSFQWPAQRERKADDDVLPSISHSAREQTRQMHLLKNSPRAAARRISPLASTRNVTLAKNISRKMEQRKRGIYEDERECFLPAASTLLTMPFEINIVCCWVLLVIFYIFHSLGTIEVSSFCAHFLCWWRRARTMIDTYWELCGRGSQWRESDIKRLCARTRCCPIINSAARALFAGAGTIKRLARAFGLPCATRSSEIAGAQHKHTQDTADYCSLWQSEKL